MEIRSLKMFCAVAESGRLVEAARKLHLTPSALSHGIKTLEIELGCRVFERVGNKLLLNPAGEQLLAQVKTPLAALEEAAESLKRLAKWGKTRLRVGATASFCQYIIPGVIRELKRNHPQVELQLASGDTPEIVELVHSNRVDLAVGITPEHNGGLEMRPIFKDELMFVFSPTHPWGAGKPISHDELRRQPLIVYHRSSITSRLANQFFQSLDLVPTTVMEVGSIEAIKELVKLNLGVSVLAPWTVDRELARGTLKARPLGAKPLFRQWAIMSLPERRMNLAEEAFCKLCRQHTTGLRLDRKDIPPLGG